MLAECKASTVERLGASWSKVRTNPNNSRAADNAVTSLHGLETRCALEFGPDSTHLSDSAERACMVEAYHRISRRRR